MSAGYSGTPLAKKLGIRPGHRLMLLNAPETLALELPDGVPVVRQARGKADVIVSFHTERRDYEQRLPKLRACMEPACGLWIAWPKKAAKVPTDLNENVVRDAGLANALVDNKVAAIDEVWSGLRLVIRLKDRGNVARSGRGMRSAAIAEGETPLSLGVWPPTRSPKTSA